MKLYVAIFLIQLKTNTTGFAVGLEVWDKKTKCVKGDPKDLVSPPGKWELCLLK